MADTQYDGAIRINTKIDESGFNRGIRNMSAKMIGLRTSIKAAFGVVPLVAEKAFATGGRVLQNFGRLMKRVLIGGLLVFGASLAGLLRGIGDTFSNLFQNNLKGTTLAKDVDAIKNKFTELKFSITAAFLPLIQVAIPYIKMALDWLIQLFNRVAMITAAFAGQKTVMQVIIGSAQKIADANKKTEKAVRNQLAAFDQINVLEKPKTGENIATPSVMTQMVPITDDILARVTEIKNIIAEWWSDPIGQSKIFIQKGLKPISDWITEHTSGFIDRIIVPMAVGITLFARDTRKALSDIWRTLIDDSLTVPEKLKGTFKIFLDWLPINVGGTMQNIFNMAIENIKTIWNGLVGWFMSNVLSPLRIIFEVSLDVIRAKFFTIFNSIRDFVSGIIAGLITQINDLIGRFNAIPLLPNLPSIPALSVAGGRTAIPRLATGGIVPAGANMLARIGERESEAVIPLSRLEEMLNGGGGGDITITMPVYLDSEKIFEGQQRVSRRRGTSLIAGGAT